MKSVRNENDTCSTVRIHWHTVQFYFLYKFTKMFCPGCSYLWLIIKTHISQTQDSNESHVKISLTLRKYFRRYSITMKHWPPNSNHWWKNQTLAHRKVKRFSDSGVFWGSREGKGLLFIGFFTLLRVMPNFCFVGKVNCVVLYWGGENGGVWIEKLSHASSTDKNTTQPTFW